MSSRRPRPRHAECRETRPRVLRVIYTPAPPGVRVRSEDPQGTGEEGLINCVQWTNFARDCRETPESAASRRDPVASKFIQ